MRPLLFRILGGKKHNEIREGQLWEVSKLWGINIQRKAVQPPEAKPRKKLAPMEMDDESNKRFHNLKPEDNSTNLTKNPDLL